MKKFVSLALLTTSLAVSAQALVLGVDAGYMVDSKEEYVSARLGHVLKADANLAHQAEVEIGYTGQKDSGLKGDFTPVTVNYRAESKAEKLGYYFGAGAGFTRTKVSGFGVSDSGTSFTVQAFAGLTYNASPTVSLHGGVKYIWIDDVKLFGVTADVGDDIIIGGGLSFKF